MSVDALVLVLVAAGLHALWSVLLAGADDVEGTTAAALLLGCLVFAQVALAGWLALRLAPPASVAAIRESSIVIAVALAALALGEPVGRRRFAGAALVAAGVAVIAIA